MFYYSLIMCCMFNTAGKQAVVCISTHTTNQMTVLPSIDIQTISNETRKVVPELRGPALVCLSVMDKKSVYWSSSWARILNVEGRIRKRTKETSSNISSPCIPPTTIMLANIHSILDYDVPRTDDVVLPTKFQFNVGPALPSIQ